MSSIIKVDNIQDQCGSAVVTKCGSTVTLGASGDTIQLACGASQTGFGRTGTVDWNTTAITADPANAVSGTGYFANTTSAAFTITLPTSPSAGDIVAVRDYAQTFATNNLTIGRNGQPIDGISGDLVLDTNGQAITLVYVDGTQGWKSVNSNETVNEQLFVTATGGTVTCCGDYKIHTFTSPGTFTVTCGGNAAGSNTVDYLVVAGGGGGGRDDFGTYPSQRYASGGGAGGFRMSNSTCMPAPTTSPLANPTGLPVTATGYPITVGAGGGGATGPCGGPGINQTGCKGSNSVFSTITSTGGGGGLGHSTGPPGAGPAPEVSLKSNGGSGGGTTYCGSYGPGCAPVPAGIGNTPPVSPSQGNPGGNFGFPSPGNFGGGGGGGAGARGGDSNSVSAVGGVGSYVSPSFAGANGTTGPVCGTRYFAGGGGAWNNGAGGSGGGSSGNTTAGTANTGGGGHGNKSGNASAGGSGIVIIRYKYQ